MNCDQYPWRVLAVPLSTPFPQAVCLVHCCLFFRRPRQQEPSASPLDTSMNSIFPYYRGIFERCRQYFQPDKAKTAWYGSARDASRVRVWWCCVSSRVRCHKRKFCPEKLGYLLGALASCERQRLPMTSVTGDTTSAMRTRLRKTSRAPPAFATLSCFSRFCK